MSTIKWSFGIASGIVIAMLAIAVKVDAQTVQNASTPANGNTFTTLTGLQITDIKVGSGESPLPGQRVTVDYRAWVYANGAKGEVFIPPGKPVEFAYATGQVPPVVDESLATMKVGGKRSVIVPGQVGFNLGPTPPGNDNKPIEVNGPPPPGFIYEIHFIK